MAQPGRQSARHAAAAIKVSLGLPTNAKAIDITFTPDCVMIVEIARYCSIARRHSRRFRLDSTGVITQCHASGKDFLAALRAFGAMPPPASPRACRQAGAEAHRHFLPFLSRRELVLVLDAATPKSRG